MSHDPVRLRDDVAAPSQLRRDLQLAAAAPAVFDVDRALDRFNQTVATGNAGASSMQQTRTILRPSARWWGTAAIGLATVLAALTWGTHHFSHRTLEQPVGLDEVRSAHSNANAAREDNRAASHSALAPNAAEPGLAIESPMPTRERADGLVANTPSTMDPASRAGRSQLLVATSAGSHGSREGTLTGATSAIPHLERNSAPTLGNTHASQSATDGSPAHGAHSGDLLHRERSQLTDAYAQFDRNPAGALALANAGNREFADGRHVEEREALAIRALSRLHHGGEARVRAVRFLQRYPYGTWSGAIREIAN